MPSHREEISKHLDFIQLTITRMGANAFLIKGWAVTLVAALLAFTAEKDKITTGAWIGLVPAVLFWGLDAYYLRQERLFRKLYDIVRVRDETDFSLHVSDIPEKERNEVKPWWRTVFAEVLWPFYGLLILVTAFVALYNPKKAETTPRAPATQSALSTPSGGAPSTNRTGNTSGP